MTEYLKASGVSRTSLYTSFYFETNKPPQKGDDGTYTIPFGILPDGIPPYFPVAALTDSEAFPFLSGRYGCIRDSGVLASERMDR